MINFEKDGWEGYEEHGIIFIEKEHPASSFRVNMSCSYKDGKWRLRRLRYSHNKESKVQHRIFLSTEGENNQKGFDDFMLKITQDTIPTIMGDIITQLTNTYEKALAARSALVLDLPSK